MKPVWSLVLSKGQSKLIPGRAKFIVNDIEDSNTDKYSLNTKLYVLEDTFHNVTLSSDDALLNDLPKER